MPLIKENDKWEWHGVQCSKCHKKSEIRIKLGSLWNTAQFDKNHRFTCKSCKRTK